MLLVLIPLSFVFFSVGELIYTVSLTFSFYVFTFIGVSVFEHGFAFTMWFAGSYFAVILCTVFELVCTYLQCLRLQLRTNEKGKRQDIFAYDITHD